MVRRTTLSRRSVRASVAAALAGGFMLGFLGSCDDRFVAFTRFVDPCVTIFANCSQGSFEVNAAGVGDFCVDPGCTVPGACGGAQPLGTITDVCP